MQLILIVYGIMGAVCATIVSGLARRNQIPLSSETYSFNTGALTWFIACLLSWPVVVPAFWVRQQRILEKRDGGTIERSPELPTVTRMSYCMLWSTLWWCVALPLYLGTVAPGMAKIESDYVSPKYIALSILIGLPLGALAGALDWMWNRKPYYSQRKGRWFNQAGVGSTLAGAISGSLLGLTEVLPCVASWEGPFLGAIAGGLVGVAVGVVYKYSALYFRLIVDS